MMNLWTFLVHDENKSCSGPHDRSTTRSQQEHGLDLATSYNKQQRKDRNCTTIAARCIAVQRMDGSYAAP